ncbi:MAG: hypothetical protein ACRC8S_15920 [Fimbriiglobus sp.]
MTTILRANCPGCRNTLRIPAEWANRPVKCQKCGTVVRTTSAAVPFVPKPNITAPTQIPSQPTYTPEPANYRPEPVNYTPPAAPVTYAPQPASVASLDFDSSNGTLGFVANETTKKYSGKKSNLGKFAGLAFVLLLVAGGVAAFMNQDAIRGAITKAMPDKNNATIPASETKANPTITPPNNTFANASKRFPRRMLFVSVTKYLYCNGLAAGNSRNTDMVSIAARRLAYQWKVPMDKDNDQLFIVQDAGAKARPMMKPVIEEAVKEFCETSRAQDRVLIYFGGHAVTVGDKAYLVPVDGDLTEVPSLIPLADFWAKVKDCPAQEKLVIFDVCRLNENGEKLRPGSEPMSEALEKALLDGPKDVQILVTASTGNNALEYRNSPTDADYVGGSLFLSSLIDAAATGKVKTPKEVNPEEALPFTLWHDTAKATMTKISGTTGKPDPTPKLRPATGTTTVAYNADEPPAKRFDLAPTPKGMAAKELATLLEPIQKIPPYKGEAIAEDAIEKLFPFTEAVMKDYKPDGVSIEEIKKDGAKYPIRKAAIESLELIVKEWKSSDSKSNGLITEISTGATDTFKKFIIQEQETPARISEELETKITQVEKLMDKLDEEKSKYWQVMYLYALAQLKARVAFMSEYNLALGNIRTDNLPKVDEGKGQAGLVLVSTEKMKSKKDVKELADSANELFTKIATDHKGTPWAIESKRYRVISLGLEWKPYVAGKSANLD